MAQFHLEIVTPDGAIFDGMADSILVRTDSGDVEIMRGHADYFASLGTGRAKLVVDGNARNASASGGFISVRGGEVKLVSTTFEFADDIDLVRAKAAKEKAENAIKAATTDRELKLAKAKLARAVSRIGVAELK